MADLLIVEDGTGKSDANTYADYAYVNDYLELQGKAGWTGKTLEDQEKAITRGTKSIDRIYKAQWKGLQTFYGTQALDWPRVHVEAQGRHIDKDMIPIALKEAVAEAALRELISPGSMTPDLERGGDIKKVKAGSVTVEYSDSASAATTFQAIDAILYDLISSAPNSSISSSDIVLGG